MQSVMKSVRTLVLATAVGGLVAVGGSAGAFAQAANPCAPKAANPCAPKTGDKSWDKKKAANPCAPKKAENPCAPKAGNPCAPKKQ